MSAPAESLAPAPSANPMRRGQVKQVLSGDAVVILGSPRPNGPPEEATVYLSNVTAPRIAKRPTDNTPGAADEPWAWQSREFLRKKLIGQPVVFIKDFTATSSRDHGRIYLGGTSINDAENVTESAVAEGWLEVRPGKVADEYTTKLLELQETAKAQKKGKWSDKTEDAVRDIKWSHSDPRSLVDYHKQKPIDAVIEQVRDGSTVRAFLLPSFDYITLQLSGVRAPSTRGVSDGNPEPFAEEAKHFVEVRVLQQDLQVVLESVSNNNFVGSIIHPKGNIAESLLREGYAKCVDWSIGLCTGGAEKLRAAETSAKDRRLRLWKGYSKPSANLGEKRKFDGRVIEIVLNDALIVLLDNGEERKVFLSSIRLPRDSNAERPALNRQFRPLYDVPFMYEAREFLRKKLIGKRVHVTVDYLQPKSEQFPEKTCCTVEIGGKNVAIELLEKGLSKVVRHRNDDENRSSQYDALLAAEANAEKEKKGLFAEKDAEPKTQRFQELQGDLAKSKQFLPYLQRGNHRAEAIVEFITSGSRMRVYVPKETCLITFLLSGISCPKSSRAGANGQVAAPAEPFANEALAFTRKLVMHKEVELEVEGLDKQGAFIGYLWYKDEDGRRVNLSEQLLEQGLSTLHFTAERSSHYNQLLAAETRAKTAKRNIFANYTDEEAEQKAEEDEQNKKTERSIQYKKVAISDVARVGPSFRFHAQYVEDAGRIERVMGDLRSAFKNNPPLASAFTPKRGELVAAKFSADGQWYRARIESIRQGVAEVIYIDFGNRESLNVDKLAALPPGLGSVPPGAKEFNLALATVPNDDDYAKSSFNALEQLFYAAPQAELNVEYTLSGAQYAQVMVEIGGERVDVGRALIEDGFALTDKRREQRLQALVTDYAAQEAKAKRERRNIWEFGDFTGNDL